MAKVKIKAVPKMQSGGYPPLTFQERDAWERMQSAARQQGFLGSEHNRQPGVDFMRQQGIDPARLPAYQADFQNFASSDPSRIRYGQQGLSNVDAFYGPKTAQQRYTKYQVLHNGQEVFAPSTNVEGSVAAANAAMAKGFENYGKPEANINYRAPEAPVTPMTPRATGLAATGFPTREEAIAKYKARKASGQELPSNYFTGKGSGDYSIDSLRRTGKGSDEYAYGGPTKRVRITGAPEMATGGYANKDASHGYGNQQVGQGYALNRFWSSPAGYPGSTSKVNPYGKVGNVLPEAKDGGDINAEKQEMVLGDFDQDGQQELMNVDGPPHTQGGKDVNVPSNSFVFSDTKDLKIKDSQILAMFGMAPKRGGYTPAFIAKKYDLNKLKKILDDPNADDMSKKTAQLMNDNYLAKLNKLAQVQEQMKGAMGMEHHDPQRGQVPAQEPPVEIVGNMDQGGAEMMQPEVMAEYGGVPQYQIGGADPDEEYGANDSMGMSDEYVENPDGSYSIRQKTAMSPQVANMMANQQVAQNTSSVYNMYPTQINEQGRVRQRPTAENMQSFIQQQLQSPPQPNKGKDALALQQELMKDPRFQEAYESSKKLYGEPLTGKFDDAIWGKRSRYVQQYLQDHPVGDYNPTIQNVTAVQDPYPDYPVPWAGNKYTAPTAPTKEEEEEEVTKRRRRDRSANTPGKQRRGIFMNPNLYGDAMNIAQMLQLQKFVPYAPVPQAVIPDTVFVDPTRAIAAQQEMARNAMEMAGQSANARAARATGLAYQGEAGKQAADTIAQYAAQNVGIANAANAQAAQITNQLMQMEANRLEELNKGNFLAARDYQREMGRLQAEWADRKQKQHDTAVKTAWLNKTSPYFNIDPYTQMPVFKSKEAKAAYEKEMKGQSDPNLVDKVKQYQAMFPKATLSELIDLAKGGAGSTRTKYGPSGEVQSSTVQTGKYGGMMRYGGSHMAMPQMAPYYQIGGSFISLAAGPDVSFNMADNTAYMMPAQNPQPLQLTSEENPVEGMPSKKANKRDIATITNNPGNIIYTPKFAKLFGAVDSGIKQSDGKGHFAMFPDLNTGFTAYQTQLFGDVDGVMKSNYYKKDTTVDQALKTWSNKGYDGSIYPEIKHKKLGELTMAERNELAKRQIKHESGDMYRLLRQRGVFKYGDSPLQKFIR